LRDTGYTWVPAGALDDGGTLTIGAQLFLGSRFDWDNPPGDGLLFDTAPGLQELIAVLHGNPPSAR
jgi:hypothetical protein